MSVSAMVFLFLVTLLALFRRQNVFSTDKREVINIEVAKEAPARPVAISPRWPNKLGSAHTPRWYPGMQVRVLRICRNTVRTK